MNHAGLLTAGVVSVYGLGNSEPVGSILFVGNINASTITISITNTLASIAGTAGQGGGC